MPTNAQQLKQYRLKNKMYYFIFCITSVLLCVYAFSLPLSEQCVPQRLREKIHQKKIQDWII